MESNASKNLVLQAIEKVIFDGGNGNFVIINLGANFYIQFALSKGAAAAWCEAIGNEYIDNEAAKLGDYQFRILKRLNWDLPSGKNRNFFQTYPVDTKENREKLAALIIDTASEVYDYHPITANDIEVNLE